MNEHTTDAMLVYGLVANQIGLLLLTILTVFLISVYKEYKKLINKDLLQQEMNLILVMLGSVILFCLATIGYELVENLVQIIVTPELYLFEKIEGAKC